MITVYKASAGSGKTFTLAKHYITLLLGIKNKNTGEYSLNLAPGPEPRLKLSNKHRAILAITFTRKATEEMKTRIVQELRALCRMPAPGEKDSEYADDLQRDLNCSRQQLADTAELALRQLLFDYQHFHVSTIDSFFQQVLKTFARELDRQADYDIELNDKEAMHSAVSAMLDDFNIGHGDANVESWLYNLMVSNIDDGKKANFFNRRSSTYNGLVELVAKISQESFKDFSADMEEYLKTDKLAAFSKTLKKYISDLSGEIIKEARKAFTGPAAIDINTFQPAGLKKLAIKFIDGKVPKYDKDDWSAAVTVNICNPDIAWGDVKRWNLNNEQKPAVKALFESIAPKYFAICAARHIQESLTQLGLLKHAWAYLRMLSAENNMLLISDTNDLLKRIIGADETPFIYERMGVALHNFLIDEFQDTSKMQWENLRPLILNSLGEKDDSLVIGDEKQSIYRFRNSDSSILHDKIHSDFPGRIVPKGSQPGENTNYRSSIEVVRFNNTLFSIIAEIAKIEGFENVVQDINPNFGDFHGFVKFFNTNKDTKNDEILAQMAQQMQRMTSEGKYDFKDVAILVNTNNEAKEVVNYLIANHPEIPILSDEALLVATSWTVQFVVSVLQIIDQADSVTPNEIINKKYLSRAQVLMALSRYEYFVNRGDLSPIEALQKALSLAQADATGATDADLEHSIERIRAKRPSSLIALIETVIASHIPEPAIRHKHSAYLAAFLDIALDFSKKEGASLHSFLDWWDANSKKAAIASGAEANAVRVMTIHKSKGLEFPCVLIPFCKWDQTWSIHQPQIWTDSLAKPHPKAVPGLDCADVPPALFVKLGTLTSLESSPFYGDYASERDKALVDTINKTYVAFTRAKSELLVWYKTYKNEGSLIGDLILKAFKQGMPHNSGAPQRLLENLAAHLDGNHFSWGQPTVKSEKDIEKDRKKRELADKAMPVGYGVVCRPDVLSITTIDDPRELDSDIDDDLDGPAGSAPSQTQQSSKLTEQQIEGIVFHDIMAHIRRPEDLDAAIEKMAARHFLTREQAGMYRKYVELFLADPMTKNWFSGFKRVYIEQPIYIPNNDEVRRPDRIVVFDDGSAHVIDYKFTDEDQNAGCEDHLRQVRLYARILRQMGYRSVTAFLAYPRLPQIIRVSTK